MTDYQETLNDMWNDTRRRVESLEKRLDAISGKLGRIVATLDKVMEQETRRRSKEF